ncbi:MAG TPA: glycoside hydrolase family 88 protein [Lacunisphaera sp.]|jgi:unsaturated rhamnogalacturonyl hydrolase|nr:glycoside hydrolase family 88 protein [Lacunisphaera sp.]
MMRRLLSALALILPPALHAEPARPEITGLMERVADWQLAHPAKWQAHEWHNGAFYAGVMALAGVSKSPRFREAMVAVGEKEHWQLGPRPYHADDHCIGQMYAELFFQDHDARKIGPLRERFDHILANRPANSLDFDRVKNPKRQERWSWCDALFMSPPAFLRLWQATGDRRYLDFAVEEWWATSDFLYNREERLYWRDSSFFPRREANGRSVHWSRGNGWVMGGLVRMLQLLPPDHPSRPRFERQFREMAAAVLACQQADGLWRASLLDPASYPMKEASGSGFFCYAFAWGVNAGLLPREPYAAAAHRAWAALAAFVQPDGRLTHVQPVGSTPVTFDENHTEPYGVGAFLLAGSEMIRLQP